MAAADAALMEVARVLAKLEVHASRQTQLLEDIAEELCGPEGEAHAAEEGEPNGSPVADIKSGVGRLAGIKQDLQDLKDLGASLGAAKKE